MAMFTRRHYEWLTHWAGNNLSRRQVQILSSDLGQTDPHFREDLFIAKYARVRNVARLPDPKRRRQQYIPRPHEAPISDLDDLP